MSTFNRMFMFCKPAFSRKRFLPNRELKQDYTFSLFEHAEDIPNIDWFLIAGKDELFLRKEYLEVIERCGHSKLQCRYVIVYRKGHPIGILYFQVIDFKAGIFGEIFGKNCEASKGHRMSIFEKYVDHNREEVLLRLVTCGNNLVSGPHGFIFRDTTEEEANLLMLELVQLIAKEERLKGGVCAILIKDFQEPLQPEQDFEEERYSHCNVEPNMVVTLPPEIESLQQYIELFSKKYRNRAKGILKAGAPIEMRYMSLEDIVAQEKELYALYDQIFERAKFKLIKLPENYFSSVKQIYPNEFTVRGFYHEGKLLAFASNFELKDGSLEAHYIGLDYSRNPEFELYQNVLYCMINEGITRKCKIVNLGRTASEIKTTVGAKAEDLICYIKPQNTISRIIQKPFVALLQPGEWTPRNPFKEA
jgi:hypothetical protein